jgi:hypothetical protein
MKSLLIIIFSTVATLVFAQQPGNTSSGVAPSNTRELTPEEVATRKANQVQVNSEDLMIVGPNSSTGSTGRTGNRVNTTSPDISSGNAAGSGQKPTDRSTNGVSKPSGDIRVVDKEDE